MRPPRLRPRPPRPRPARRRAGLRRRATTALVLLVAVVAAACSGSSSGTGGTGDDDVVSAVVTGNSALPAEARGCIAQGMADDDDARQAVEPEHEPTEAEFRALADVLDGCASAEAYAASVAAQITESLPPTDTTATDAGGAQTACLDQRIVELGADDRHTLLVGLVALGSPAVGELSQRRADVVNGLFEACGVSLGP